jgi:hypothetical protein
MKYLKFESSVVDLGGRKMFCKCQQGLLNSDIERQAWALYGYENRGNDLTSSVILLFSLSCTSSKTI